MWVASPKAATLLSRSNTAGRSIRALLPPALFLLAFLLYLPPYKQAFVGDDYVQLGYISSFLQRPLSGLQTLNPFWSDWYFRPLQNLWLLFCRLLFGLNPFGYYAFQGLWHLLAGAALFALARKLGLRWGAALLALTLFLVNSHHHDVVAWISSIAAIQAAAFSFLALYAYLQALQSDSSARWWLATAVFSLLTMLSHEAGVLLPFFLLYAGYSHRPHAAKGAEKALLAALLMLAAALAALHFFRPNATIDLGGQSAAQWLAALHPRQLAAYTATVAGRWLLLNKTALGNTLLTSALESGFFIAPAILFVGLLLAAYRFGGRVVRLSIVWIVINLAFIYLAVWQQKPDLLAGRHLYSSWAFLSLSIAWAATRLVAHKRSGMRRAALTLLLAFLALNIALVGDDQQAWQRHTEEVAHVAQQMRALIPQATANTQIYAQRFVLTPSFTPYAAAVWYGEPGIGGGSLAKLQSIDEVDGETYLLDYQDGQLFNIMPQLQDFSRSRILWLPHEATLSSSLASGQAGAYDPLQMAQAAGERRLALHVMPPENGWLTLHYQMAGPDSVGNSFHQLATAILGPEGAAFRVRLRTAEGVERVAFQQTINRQQSGAWLPLHIPLSWNDGAEAATILLDVQTPPGAAAYWAVPALVRP